MVTLVFALHRRPELSEEEFHRYWREQHAPLVRKHADALGIRRYSQLHTLDTPLTEAVRASRGCAPSDYDGVALVWFDGLDALGAAAATPEGLAAGAALREDEQRFLDLERCAIWLTEDHPVVEARA
jgi:uncharacterized protein (TIGR02118 family)